MVIQLDGLLANVARSVDVILSLNSEEKEHELIRYLFKELPEDRAGYFLESLVCGYPLLQSSYSLIIELAELTDTKLTKDEREDLLSQACENRDLFRQIVLRRPNGSNVTLAGVKGTRASYARLDENLIAGQDNLITIAVGVYGDESHNVDNQIFQLVSTEPIDHYPSPQSYGSQVSALCRYHSDEVLHNSRFLQISMETWRLIVGNSD
jgi:hypothetical protein